MAGWGIFHIHIQNIPHIGSIDFWRVFAIIQGIYINDKELAGRKRRKMLRNESEIEAGDPPGENFPARGPCQRDRRLLAEKTQGGDQQCPSLMLQIPAGGYGYRVLPFTQLGAVRTGDQGEVEVGGSGMAEKPLQMDLARRGEKKVAPPHHLGHTRSQQQRAARHSEGGIWAQGSE